VWSFLLLAAVINAKQMIEIASRNRN